VRRRFFRNVRVLLECGHEALLSTSLYRLTRDKVRAIVSHQAGRGVWCDVDGCGGCCAIVRVIGTERGSEC
jgi:hypothetical protein